MTRIRSATPNNSGNSDEMIKIVTDGKGQDMDGYGKTLSKDQIKGLVDFYRGLAK